MAQNGPKYVFLAKTRFCWRWKWCRMIKVAAHILRATRRSIRDMVCKKRWEAKIRLRVFSEFYVFRRGSKMGCFLRFLKKIVKIVKNWENRTGILGQNRQNLWIFFKNYAMVVERNFFLDGKARYVLFPSKKKTRSTTRALKRTFGRKVGDFRPKNPVNWGKFATFSARKSPKSTRVWANACANHRTSSFLILKDKVLFLSIEKKISFYDWILREKIEWRKFQITHIIREGVLRI